MDPVTKKPWLWQVTGLSILLGVLGVLIVTAIGTQRNADKNGIPGGGFAGLLNAYSDLKSINDTLQRDKLSLQQKVWNYEGIVSKGSSAVSAVRQELDQARFLAGLTPVKGPGLEVTLRDSDKAPPDAPAQIIEDYIIHDYDIRNIINELKASGAEAIEVNGQRVIASTWVRCVGPVIQVNGVPVGGKKFVIKATGNPEVMENGLRLAGGVLAGFISVDEKMVSIERQREIKIPAYSGSTNFIYTKPAR